VGTEEGMGHDCCYYGYDILAISFCRAVIAAASVATLSDFFCWGAGDTVDVPYFIFG